MVPRGRDVSGFSVATATHRQASKIRNGSFGGAGHSIALHKQPFSLIGQFAPGEQRQCESYVCVIVLAASQRARQLTKRLLMLLVRDLGEVAGDFEQQSLMRRDRPRLLFEPFVEKRDRRIEQAGDLEKLASRDTVFTAFVFMHLLIGHADHFAELLLGQTEHDPALADAR
jgi:hypothetical protein